MRERRIKVSDSQLDKQEMDWWDSNAATIEKIWALNFQFQKAIRLPYLKKMKQFFMLNSDQKPIKILEIGCGTGWVCRMIADENLHVVGTDFSVGQLAIAKDQAKRFHKEEFCSYQLADASIFNKDFDGVVIHALLHHLTIQELTIFFEQLSKIQSGTKVFIYEPVFIERYQGSLSLMDKVLNKIINKLKKISINRAKKMGSPNKELRAAMEKIYEDARANGWYISPKEVPFYQNELYSYLSPLFTFHKEYIVNKSDLEISQSLVMNKIEKPDFLFSKILLPLSTWLDKQACKGNFSFFIKPWDHQFVCFELVRK